MCRRVPKQKTTQDSVYQEIDPELKRASQIRAVRFGLYVKRYRLGEGRELAQLGKDGRIRCEGDMDLDWWSC